MCIESAELGRFRDMTTQPGMHPVHPVCAVTTYEATLLSCLINMFQTADLSACPD